MSLDNRLVQVAINSVNPDICKVHPSYFQLVAEDAKSGDSIADYIRCFVVIIII